jgi:hypothetical protein
MRGENNTPKTMKKIMTLLAGIFRPAGKTTNSIKPTFQHKPAVRVQHDDEIHWCHHQRHGMFPVPREFLTRGHTEGSGKPYSVFQCTDERCREFVAAVIRNDNPLSSWVLFRGQNYRSRPERRPVPVASRNSITPRRASSQYASFKSIRAAK